MRRRSLIALLVSAARSRRLRALGRRRHGRARRDRGQRARRRRGDPRSHPESRRRRRSIRRPSTATSARSTRWASSRTSRWSAATEPEGHRPRLPRARAAARHATSRSRATRRFADEDLEAALKVRPRTILDPEKLRRGIADAKKLYEEKGYLDATITPRTDAVPGDRTRSTITYVVNEGKLVRIQRHRDRGQRRVQRRAS